MELKPPNSGNRYQMLLENFLLILSRGKGTHREAKWNDCNLFTFPGNPRQQFFETEKRNFHQKDNNSLSAEEGVYFLKQFIYNYLTSTFFHFPVSL